MTRQVRDCSGHSRWSAGPHRTHRSHDTADTVCPRWNAAADADGMTKCRPHHRHCRRHSDDSCLPASPRPSHHPPRMTWNSPAAGTRTRRSRPDNWKRTRHVDKTYNVDVILVNCSPPITILYGTFGFRRPLPSSFIVKLAYIQTGCISIL